MNVIILCGGLSTRLGDITKEIPKILLPVGEKAVLDWQLDKLVSLGIEEVVLAAGHLSDVLKNTVGEERNGIKIRYVVEEKKLGTGGAIKYALTYVSEPNEPTLVLNGDVLVNIDLADMVSKLKPESDGIILATRVDDVATYGTLVYDETGHLQEFKEKEKVHKPGYINGGIYLFTSRVHDYFPTMDTFSIEYDVFPNMRQLYVYESDHPWVDVGVPERLEWARKHWQSL
jgi:NDP-sugar pyrophosphorylase family protein